MKKLTQEELRNFYKHEYVSQFPLVDNGKIKRLFKYISLDRHDKIVDFGCGNGLLLDFVFDNNGANNQISWDSPVSSRTNA